MLARSRFESELDRLRQELLSLGEAVCLALRESADVLYARDHERALMLIRGDAAINERRFAIESGCLTLVATQQPMARDMRVLAAMLEIATELERTGDYAKGVARISILIGDQPIGEMPEFRPMVAKVTDLLHRALAAFVSGDAESARAIPKEDDEIDALYNSVYRRVLQAMVADPGFIDEGSQLMWVAHNYERAGDRVTNICERTVFMVTGEMREMDSEDGVLPVVPNTGGRPAAACAE